MKIWTYGEIEDKVRLDTDTQNEEFVTFDELVGYGNEGIDEAEAEIHNIYEDYFLTNEAIPLVAGTAKYSLPADIYGNKLRHIVYHNNNEIYPIKRIRDANRFLKMANNDEFGGTDQYRYVIINDSVAIGVQIRLYPTSRETSSTVAEYWYLRNATRIPLSTEGTEVASRATQVDIPEFASFVQAWMKMRIYEKELNAQAENARLDVEKQRKQMVDTLTQMVPDNDNIIDHDYSFYEDFYANTTFVSDY